MGVEKGERVVRLRKALAIIKALWAGVGRPVSFDGRFWSVEDVRLQPQPVRPKLELARRARAGGAAPRRADRGRLAWASFVGPDEFPGMVDTIRAAVAGAGRSIDEDHYGATIFAAPAEDELSTAARGLLARRPGLAREDHVTYGAAQLRALLERFVAAGASKFVVFPIAADPDPVAARAAHRGHRCGPRDLGVSPEQVVQAADGCLSPDACVSAAMVVGATASRQGLRCVLAL